MTIQSSSLNAFSVAPRRGRSPKPLSILGHDMFVKLANADTGGAVAIFEHPVPAMGGPPLHRHSREDEWFYVLDGQITVQVDGERISTRPRFRRVAAGSESIHRPKPSYFHEALNWQPGKPGDLSFSSS